MKRLVGALALFTLGALPTAAMSAPASASHFPLHDLRHGSGHIPGTTTSTSTNWAGYDVTGSGATYVTGSWTQPQATCSAGENSWSSPWVGLDGDTSNTVEQIGTDTDCSNGAPYYYAWYEMYPKSLVTINVPVNAGDKFTASVTANPDGTFTLTLNNTTRNVSYSTNQPLKRAHLASAEWIMEGQSNGTLTNFGSINFTGSYATINGTTGYLNTLSPIDAISNVVSGVTRATPSSLGKNGAFSVTWNHG